MSLTAGPRCRPLVRGAAVGAVVLASGLLGAPAASAAEDGRPVIALDPPEVVAFLVPTENAGMLGGFEVGAASPDGSTSEPADPVATLEQIAPLLPDEVAGALGVDEAVGAAAAADLEGAVDVAYGGTVELTLPAEVDASAAEFTLELVADDFSDPSYFLESDSPLPANLLTVNDLGGNEFAVTLPAAAVGTYGPEAYLTVDGLTSADPGVAFVESLDYWLDFTGPAAPSVSLAPVLGLYADAVCSFDDAFDGCTAATVRAGSPVDVVVPPTSLLTSYGYGRLDNAFYSLESMDDAEPWETFDSETNPDLVTVHGPSSATLTVPAAARPAPYFGFVAEGNPAGGIAFTSFQIEVEAVEAAPVPVNAGLHSDTGWVEEVRDGSSGSTAAVAGGALLLVGGLVALVAVRPARRPPLGG
jgi:hypothetical protein